MPRVTPGKQARGGQPAATSLWSNRNFTSLWLGETLSQTGSQITAVAFPLVAVLTLGAGVGVVGLLTTLQYLPILLLSLLAGQWVDRYSVKTIMVTCHLARAGLIAIVPIAYWADALNVTLLLADAFAVGAFTAVFDVAYVAYVPRLVTREHVADANARLESTYSIAEAAGPGVGGMLVQALGAPLAPLADVASYGAAAVLAGTMRPATEAVSPGSLERRPLRAIAYDMTRSVSVILRHPVLRPLVMQSAAFNLLGLVAFTLFLVFGVQDLDLPPAALGWILATASVGALLGVLTAVRLADRFGSGQVCFWATVLCSVALGLIPAATGPKSVAASLLVLGFLVHGVGLGISNVNSLNIRAECIEPDQLGRVTGGWRLLSHGTIPLNGLVASGLGLLLGPRWAIAVSVTLLTLALALLPSRRLREYRSPIRLSGADATPPPIAPRSESSK